VLVADAGFWLEFFVMTFSSWNMYNTINELLTTEENKAYEAKRVFRKIGYASWYPVVEPILASFRIISMLLFRFSANHSMQSICLR
jgi:hypothetical protein